MGQPFYDTPTRSRQRVCARPSWSLHIRLTLPARRLHLHWQQPRADDCKSMFNQALSVSICSPRALDFCVSQPSEQTFQLRELGHWGKGRVTQASSRQRSLRLIRWDQAARPWLFLCLSRMMPYFEHLQVKDINDGDILLVAEILEQIS